MVQALQSYTFGRGNGMTEPDAHLDQLRNACSMAAAIEIEAERHANQLVQLLEEAQAALLVARTQRAMCERDYQLAHDQHIGSLTRSLRAAEDGGRPS